MPRFSRLRDGEHDAPVRARAPLTTTQGRAAQIAAGEVTRHYVHAPRDPDAECRFREGMVYAVQHMVIVRHLGWRRDKPSQPRKKGETVGRVRVVDVRRGVLGDETNAQAKRAGFLNRKDMLAHWTAERGLKHPERKQVFVVTFEPETWAPAEMLAADSSHGFTTNPQRALVSDRSEVVRPEQLRPSWTEEAKERHKAAENVDGYKRRQRQLRDQIRRISQTASKKGIDVSDDLERVQAELKKLRERLEAA